MDTINKENTTLATASFILQAIDAVFMLISEEDVNAINKIKNALCNAMSVQCFKFSLNLLFYHMTISFLYYICFNHSFSKLQHKIKFAIISYLILTRAVS